MLLSAGNTKSWSRFLLELWQTQVKLYSEGELALEAHTRHTLSSINNLAFIRKGQG